MRRLNNTLTCIKILNYGSIYYMREKKQHKRAFKIMKAFDEGGSGRGHHLCGVCVDGDGSKIRALRAKMENGMERK